jgi:purine-cytosine permease-like protein
VKLLPKGFKLQSREIALACAITALGLLFTLRPVLMFLNTLNPFVGMIIYYVVLYGALMILGHFGLTIFSTKIKKPLQTFGLLLITFAFFIAVGLSSSYIQYETAGTVQGASPIYFQCEDGAVVYLWTLIIPLTSSFNATLIWMLSYGLTPFVLALIGGLLAFDKPKLGF